MQKKSLFFLVLCFIFSVSIGSNNIAAQTHISVPLGHPVYTVLEQAQMRGLCAFLPGVKPYSKASILLIIEEILNTDENRRFGGLTETERRILEQFKHDFSPERGGLDLIRGTISTEHDWNDVYFSAEFGFGMEMTFAGAYFPVAGGFKYDGTDEESLFWGAKHPGSGDFFADLSLRIPSISFIGDLGRNASYGFSLVGFIGRSPRAILGRYNHLVDNPEETIIVQSEPLAYFPFTYKKRWDGFIFPYGDYSSGSMVAWPEGISLGYTMLPELAGILLNGHVFYRFARIDREWAGMTNNGSLALNQSAQPFLAFETLIQPFPWITFSSLTGVLEYDSGTDYSNDADLKDTAESFQNAFSMVMLEFNIKNYFNLGIGSSVIWPKRFELGYPFPFIENFLYQNNIGDFDNMALFLNLQGQYPGIGRLWFSLFVDEFNIRDRARLFELDRQMFAFQMGGSVFIPWLPFSSVTFSYTKIEPYNYTHARIDVPWYRYPMETNFVNFGRSLGSYLPPNSDEFLVRFETIPFVHSMFSLQYQMIRHGANYGDRAVDGSSLWSEMHGGRNTNPALRKYFLRDGAYQWMHVLRLRGEYSLTGLRVPVKLFGEIGGVYSYFTDIEGEVNSGSPGSYSIIDTPQYPHSLRIIGILGVQIFPKF
jgi:hypothetical protein